MLVHEIFGEDPPRHASIAALIAVSPRVSGGPEPRPGWRRGSVQDRLRRGRRAIQGCRLRVPAIIAVDVAG
jgi:hypothetical protein